MQFTAKGKTALGVLGVIVLVGIVFYAMQLSNGLGVTGMSNGTSWGLYITNFMFFVGLSAGGLIVASSASVFGIEKFKKVALPAVIVSTVSICLAAIFILIDLGGIQRIWQMLAHPNFSSPLVWDMCVITLYLIINILDLVWLTKGDERKVTILSRFALPTAILVHSVTAWIFGLEIAKEGWYTAILAPIFVASALDSGLALLLIALAALKKANIFDCGKDLMKSLAGLLATCIAIDAFFIGCEILTTAYPGTEAGSALLGIMTSGATAPFFWAEIVLGLLVPFCILVFAKNRENAVLVTVSSVLVVCGVFCKRVWLLFTSFFMGSNVAGAPGVSGGSAASRAAEGMDIWSLAATYAPTGYEIAIVLGVLALGVAVFMLLSKKLIK